VDDQKDNSTKKAEVQRARFDALAQRMIAGEDEAFETFSDIFGPRFKAMFLAKGLDVCEAEDLAVTCVSDIAIAIGQYSQAIGGGFEAWAFTIARHRLVDWWRDHKVQTIPLCESMNLVDQDCIEDDTVLSVAVRETVKLLSIQDQEIIALRYLSHSQSYEEIASVLGISKGAVRVRMMRTLQKLAQKLSANPTIREFLRKRQSITGLKELMISQEPIIKIEKALIDPARSFMTQGSGRAGGKKAIWFNMGTEVNNDHNPAETIDWIPFKEPR
jgi:RNA polymerase sigma factor (sigma-70 family)